MASERQAPDAILAQTNLSGAVTAIQDDPDSPDGSWLTAPGNNNNTEVRVSFASPSGNPTTGAGLQNFRVQVRKTNHSTDPSCTIELYEGGSLVATLVSGQTVSSTTGIVIEGTWDASSLGTADGSAVECRVTGATGGGSPGNRASLEVGAIEWNVDYSVAGRTGDLAATDAPDTSAFAGAVPVSGDLASTDALDTASLAGDVLVEGDLASTDPADSAAFSGGSAAAIEGDLAATEAPDVAAIEASAPAQGNLASTEAADTAALAGQVIVLGALTVSEAIDLAALNGITIVQGDAAAIEGVDMAAMVGAVAVQGDLVSTEAADTASFLYAKRQKASPFVVLHRRRRG